MQVGILIGKNGAAMKKLGQLARTDIEHFLERPVSWESERVVWMDGQTGEVCLGS
jgi:GTPase Era involved in 16S rRNA processing